MSDCSSTDEASSSNARNAKPKKPAKLMKNATQTKEWLYVVQLKVGGGKQVLPAKAFRRPPNGADFQRGKYYFVNVEGKDPKLPEGTKQAQILKSSFGSSQHVDRAGSGNKDFQEPLPPKRVRTVPHKLCESTDDEGVVKKPKNDKKSAANDVKSSQSWLMGEMYKSKATVQNVNIEEQVVEDEPSQPINDNILVKKVPKNVKQKYQEDQGGLQEPNQKKPSSKGASSPQQSTPLFQPTPPVKFLNKRRDDPHKGDPKVTKSVRDPSVIRSQASGSPEKLLKKDSSKSSSRKVLNINPVHKSLLVNEKQPRSANPFMLQRRSDDSSENSDALVSDTEVPKGDAERGSSSERGTQESKKTKKLMSKTKTQRSSSNNKMHPASNWAPSELVDTFLSLDSDVEEMEGSTMTKKVVEDTLAVSKMIKVAEDPVTLEGLFNLLNLTLKTVQDNKILLEHLISVNGNAQEQAPVLGQADEIYPRVLEVALDHVHYGHGIMMPLERYKVVLRKSKTSQSFITESARALIGIEKLAISKLSDRGDPKKRGDAMRYAQESNTQYESPVKKSKEVLNERLVSALCAAHQQWRKLTSVENMLGENSLREKDLRRAISNACSRAKTEPSTSCEWKQGKYKLYEDFEAINEPHGQQQSSGTEEDDEVNQSG